MIDQQNRELILCSVPPPEWNNRNKWNRKVSPEQRYGGLSLEIVDRVCPKCSTCSIPLVERNNSLLGLVIQLVVQEGNDGFEVVFQIFDARFLVEVLFLQLRNLFLKTVNSRIQPRNFFLLVGLAILPCVAATR